jgi:Imidazolonepropionase and related amidohydrolases
LYAFAAIGLLGAVSAFGQSTAITNARIVTVSGAAIEKGTVVIRDGLIESVGANAKVPADAVVVDGTGLTVYPGFVDALTNLGLATAPARPAGGGGGGGGAAAAAAAQQAPTSNSNFPAGLRPEDMTADDIRAGEAQFEAARNAGFTTALTVGRTGIFNGQSVLINLAGDSVSRMIVRSPIALHVSYNTIPGTYPGSLLGTFSAMRQMFLDARRHQQLQKDYAANPRGMKRPEADRSLEALIPALDRQIPVVFNANSEIEIIRSLDFAKEFNLRPIIAGATEAYKVIDRLKAANASVLLSLNFPKRTTAASAEADPESLETLRQRAEAPKNAGKLAAAGVKFAFQSGAMTSLADFPTNAGKAVEAGLNKDAAVRAMTLGAAEMFGVADRIGSIETGKIANLTVVRGDALKKERVVTHVIVDGKMFEMKAPVARPATNGTGPRPEAAATAIAGTYNISIDVPGQLLTGTLNLQQQGTEITGTMVTQLGTTQITNGRATASGFTFGGAVVFGGTSIDITVTGTVTGNSVSGTVDSPQGAVPFTGTRVP